MINNKDINDHNISRKAALKKIGKYAAITTIGTYAILNPLKSQAQSIPDGSGGGGNPFD